MTPQGVRKGSLLSYHQPPIRRGKNNVEMTMEEKEDPIQSPTLSEWDLKE